MKALLLTGGFGTRLRPLTYTRPKHLLPIANRPHMEHVFDALARHGISDVVLLTSYLAEAFGPAIESAREHGLDVEVTLEPEPLGTAGAIKNAEPLIADDSFLVINGDILTDVDLGQLVSFHGERRAEATILLTPVEDPSRYGVVPTDADGRVLGFIEKPPASETPTNLINAGIYLFEPSVLERIPPAEMWSAEHQLFPGLVSEEARLFALGTRAYWIDIGTPRAYLEANMDALAGRYRGNGDVPADDAGVLRGDGAVVARGARVSSTCLGGRATVAEGATVTDSVLLPDAVVGEGATVVRSILGQGARVRPGGRVVEAAIADGADVTQGVIGGMMRVLVTGAAGFIGSHLVDRLLAEGDEVVGIDDLSSGSEANLAEARAARLGRLSWYHEDVTSAAAQELVVRHRPEVIFHLAAQVDVRRSVADPVHDAMVNVIGSVNLLQAAVKAGTRKFVFTSSGGCIYGEPDPGRLPVTEDQVFSREALPESPYGVSKKVMLDYLRYFRAVQGLDFTALALSNVYGPRQEPATEIGLEGQVVAIFCRRMLAGKPCTIYGDGSQTRDFVFVDDVVGAFAAARERGGGELLNIGSGSELSVRDLHDRLAEQVGQAPEPVYADARPGELQRIVVAPERAAAELGWRPGTALADGLKQTVAWFRST